MCLMLMSNMPFSVTMKTEKKSSVSCCKRMDKAAMNCHMKMKNNGKKATGCDEKETTCGCIFCFVLLAAPGANAVNYRLYSLADDFIFHQNKYNDPVLDLVVPPPDASVA